MPKKSGNGFEESKNYEAQEEIPSVVISHRNGQAGRSDDDLLLNRRRIRRNRSTPLDEEDITTIQRIISKDQNRTNTM